MKSETLFTVTVKVKFKYQNDLHLYDRNEVSSFAPAGWHSRFIFCKFLSKTPRVTNVAVCSGVGHSIYCAKNVDFYIVGIIIGRVAMATGSSVSFR